MKMKKIKYFIITIFSVLYLYFFGPFWVELYHKYQEEAQAHDIDNRSKKINAFPEGLGEANFRYDVSQPHHCADNNCEGQVINKCLTNPTKVNGRTFQMRRKNFWHFRRLLIAQIQLLAGATNALTEWQNANLGTNPPMPAAFMNYDPFWLQKDPYHPDVWNAFKVKYNGILNTGYDALEVRYDYFWLTHNLNVGGISGNTLIEYKKCKDLRPDEKMHSFECAKLSPETYVLTGGNSYRNPEPWRSEDAFVYYDRIPGHPVMDACMKWVESEWTWEEANNYAEAHERAGKIHLEHIWKRLKYAEMVLRKVRGY